MSYSKEKNGICKILKIGMENRFCSSNSDEQDRSKETQFSELFGCYNLGLNKKNHENWFYDTQLKQL